MIIDSFYIVYEICLIYLKDDVKKDRRRTSARLLTVAAAMRPNWTIGGFLPQGDLSRRTFTRLDIFSEAFSCKKKSQIQTLEVITRQQLPRRGQT